MDCRENRVFQLCVLLLTFSRGWALRGGVNIILEKMVWRKD